MFLFEAFTHMYFFSKKRTSVLNLSNLWWKHQQECFLVWEEVIFFYTKIHLFFQKGEESLYPLHFCQVDDLLCLLWLIITFAPTEAWSTNLSQILFRELMRITELCSLFTSLTENKLWPPLFRSRSFTPVQRTAWHIKHITVLITAFSSKRILMSFNLDSFLEFFFFSYS